MPSLKTCEWWVKIVQEKISKSSCYFHEYVLMILPLNTTLNTKGFSYNQKALAIIYMYISLDTLVLILKTHFFL